MPNVQLDEGVKEISENIDEGYISDKTERQIAGKEIWNG